jgi:hypothetical protein
MSTNTVTAPLPAHHPALQQPYATTLTGTLDSSRSPYYTTNRQVARMYITLPSSLYPHYCLESKFLSYHFPFPVLSLSANNTGDATLKDTSHTWATRVNHTRRPRQTRAQEGKNERELAFGSRTTVIGRITSRTVPYGSLRVNLTVRVESGMMP